MPQITFWGRKWSYDFMVSTGPPRGLLNLKYVAMCLKHMALNYTSINLLQYWCILGMGGSNVEFLRARVLKMVHLGQIGPCLVYLPVP